MDSGLPARGISIHSLRMEGDKYASKMRARRCNFNPLPPHGGRQDYPAIIKATELFQSTPSAWRETSRVLIGIPSSADFNPLPPHGGRLCQVDAVCSAFHISIHSLRMEGDCRTPDGKPGDPHFNPLPPHGGRHGMQYHIPDAQPGFQSTPSAWRETVPKTVHAHLGDHFNPLPPHGGRPFLRAGICIPTPHISIHSLRMEGDGCTPGTPADASYFNPLPPHGGRRASGH